MLELFFGFVYLSSFSRLVSLTVFLLVLTENILMQATCKPGYVRSRGKCVDENECESDPSVCGNNAACFNTDGSYYCQCHEGFTTHSAHNFTQADGIQCQDLNECKDGSADCGPNALCLNSEGGYMCICAADYTSSNGKEIFNSGEGVQCIGTQPCPLHLSQQRVVVRYGDSVEVNCNTSVQHEGMGWESSENPVPLTRDPNLITWRVSELREWDIQPYCYINYKINQNYNQCNLTLSVTVYKTPDSVSISTVKHTGPMTEGQQYVLQCDVHNVAPVQYLTVKWYKGQTLLDQTSFSNDIKTPVNETVTLLIRADRDDDGAEYRCEAELDLGAEGPQPPPTITSDPLNVQVYYKPKYSSSTETIIKDNKDMLNCTVKANPAPTYTWDHLKEKNSSSVLESSSLSPGNYMCTATNFMGNGSKVFIVKSTGIRPTFWTVLTFLQLLFALIIVI